MQSSLHTPRLELVVLGHATLLTLAAGDAAAGAAEALRLPSPWPEDDAARQGLPIHAEALARGVPAPWRVRAVVLRAGSVPVGTITLKGPPRPDGSVELGWGISQAHRRQGYASEAAAAVLHWALAQPGTLRVFATIPPDNLASQRVAARLGLRPTDALHRGLPVWARERAAHPEWGP